VQILLWVISKYADKKKLLDIEKDLVSLLIFRTLKIGRPLLLSFLVFLESLACSNGSALKKSISPPIIGAKRKATFWPNLSIKKASKANQKIQKIGNRSLKGFTFSIAEMTKSSEMLSNVANIGTVI